MNFQKSDAAIGAFVLLAAAIFVLALAAVNRARFTVETYPLYIQLPHIAGIDKGVEVMYQGYKAGAVDQIRIAYKPKLHFIVRMAVKKEIQLRQGTTAVVRSKGFGMGRFLEFSSPEGEGPMIPEGETLPTLRETDLMAKANEVMGDLQRVVKNLQKEGAAVELIHAVRRANLVLANLDRTLTNLNALVEENRDPLRAAIRQTQGLTARTNELLSRRGAALEQTLESLSQSLAHLPAIMMSLEEFIVELNRHPWRLVRKGSPPAPSPKLEHKHAPR